MRTKLIKIYQSHPRQDINNKTLILSKYKFAFLKTYSEKIVVKFNFKNYTFIALKASCVPGFM